MHKHVLERDQEYSTNLLLVARLSVTIKICYKSNFHSGRGQRYWYKYSTCKCNLEDTQTLKKKNEDYTADCLIMFDSLWYQIHDMPSRQYQLDFCPKRLVAYGLLHGTMEMVKGIYSDAVDIIEPVKEG